MQHKIEHKLSTHSTCTLAIYAEVPRLRGRSLQLRFCIADRVAMGKQHLLVSCGAMTALSHAGIDSPTYMLPDSLTRWHKHNDLNESLESMSHCHNSCWLTCNQNHCMTHSQSLLNLTHKASVGYAVVCNQGHFAMYKLQPSLDFLQSQQTQYPLKVKSTQNPGTQYITTQIYSHTE